MRGGYEMYQHTTRQRPGEKNAVGCLGGGCDEPVHLLLSTLRMKRKRELSPLVCGEVAYQAEILRLCLDDSEGVGVSLSLR